MVALIMMGAASYVATYQPSMRADTSSGPILQERARNLMEVALDTPLREPNCLASTHLQKLVTDGIAGDHAYWNEKVKNYLGPGVDASLLLHNGVSFYPLHGDSQLQGITEERWLSLDLQYAKPLPMTGHVSGTEALEVALPSIVESSLIRASGDATRISASYAIGTSQDADRTEVAWGLTALLDPRPETQGGNFTQNLTWIVLDESSNASVLLSRGYKRIETTDGLNPALERLRLRVAGAPDSAGNPRPLPVGVELTVRLPAGWTNQTTATDGWVPLDSETANTTGVIRLRLGAEGLTSQNLQFSLIPPASSPARFHPVHASLSNGSLGESTFVFVNERAVERDLPRSLYLTTPYPIRPGSDALFGAVLANGGEAITVRRLDLEIPGGYDLRHHNGTGAPLFANDFNTTDAQGGHWTRVDDRHVRWTGERNISALEASFWSVNIPVTRDTTHYTGIEPRASVGPLGTLRFDNGHSASSTRWGDAPGVVVQRVPPASNHGASADGYPWSPAELGSNAPHSFAGEITSTRAHLEGISSYRVGAQSSDMQRLQSGMANSTLAVASRLVPIGSFARVDGNLESVLTTVSESGATSMALTLDVYSPFSRGCEPTLSSTVAVSGLPANAVTASLVWDGGTGIASLFAATEDRVVHRLGPSGAPLWSHQLEAKPVLLAKGEPNLGAAYLLVGDDAGAVHRLDVATGALVWSSAIPVDVGGSLGRVVTVTANATTDRILVATSGGALALLDPQNGHALESRHSAGDAYVSAAFGPAGAVYAVTATSALRANATLGVQASTLVAGGARALAVGHQYVLVSSTLQATLLDPVTLGAVHYVGFPGEAVLATSGDATGDMVHDLVLAFGSNEFLVISGATGQTAWTYSAASVPAARGAEGWLAPESLLLEQGRSLNLCSDAPATYTANARCFPDHDLNRPIAISAEAGALSAVLEINGLPYMLALDANGAPALLRELDPLSSYTHASHGAWGLETGTATGTTRGALILHTPLLVDAMSSTPSERLGRFTYYVPTPMGGFFGTHLVVATLEWTTASGIEQKARLLDWFEVVAPDGKPVTHPAYRVVLVASDRGDPLARPDS